MTGIIQDCSSNIQIGMDNDTRMISRLRTYMMGVSILWVVLFHTSGIFILPPALRAFQNTGYLGVDIFIFLSAYGLCNSIQRNSSLSLFFRRRVARVIPYFIMVMVLLLLLTDLTWKSFFYEITFVGFSMPWLCHGVIYWYIPAILLFYLLFPSFYKKREIIKKYYVLVSLIAT